ncbi:CaiB/BaiF CoA transferase family protein [Rhabdonatronobacter sediminivivens]
MSTPKGPLAGLRIIEMAGIGPAPFAAMMLSDMGAEVIRVHPLRAGGDIPLMNTRFDVLARGRRSMAIDLKAEGAAAVLLDMIARADGLIEGFRPGVMERLGLGPAPALALNPALVYGRMTGWGQDGPMAPRAGHDIDYIALSGVLGAMGPGDGPPTVPLNLVGDFGGGGMLMAFGMMCGLWHARATGQGQVVDAAMTEGAALLATMLWGFRAGGAWGGARGANLLDGGAPFYGTYECADGGFMAVGAIEGKFFAEFCTRMGIDPVPAQDDPTLWPQQRADLAARFAAHPRAHWEALFDGSDACVAPVLDWDEAPAHPHNAARRAFIAPGGVTQPAPAPRFSSTPPATPGPAGAAGAETGAVLADWGIGADRIDSLRARGIIEP